MKVYPALIGFLACTFVYGETSATDSQKLQSLLEPINSLSASFTQSIYDAGGYELDSSEGLFKVASPAKVLWHVTAPLEQRVISDGHTLWIYDPDLDQVVINKVDNRINATPAVLFSGNLESLEASYEVEQKSFSIDAPSFLLTPRENGSLFATIELQFATLNPSAIIITDTLGQSTAIILDHLLLNPVLEAETFTFSIPSGVDVINNVQ
jgi:outer membrane lipoprotein carrier protein